MKYLFTLIAIASLGLVSCESPVEAKKNTATSFASPQEVGKLPDGRKVKCVVVDNANGHDHFIYFVEGSVTVNQAVQSGKTTINQTTVLIDGVPYTPKVEK